MAGGLELVVKFEGFGKIDMESFADRISVMLVMDSIT